MCLYDIGQAHPVTLLVAVQSVGYTNGILAGEPYTVTIPISDILRDNQTRLERVRQVVFGSFYPWDGSKFVVS